MIDSKILSSVKYGPRNKISLLQSVIKHYIIPDYLISEICDEDKVIFDLGCGEGILANYIARMKPNSRVYGFDIDEGKIDIANFNSLSNSEFHKMDFFDITLSLKCNVLILNDVIHHFHYEKQMELLETISKYLAEGGKLIIKEVDQEDFWDKKLTTFFDSKIYPDDQLSYRTKEEWKSISKRLNLNDITTYKVKTFWPASRTIIFGKLLKNLQLLPSQIATEIGNELCKNKEEYYNVLLTGGTGFIGKHVAKKLLNSGINGKKVRVVLLSRSKDNVPGNIIKNENVYLLLGDLQDLPYLSNALNSIDYVFHLAAEVKFFGGSDLWRNNYYGTISLLKVLKDTKIKRFIYASTIGAVDRTPQDNCLRPLVETDTPNPYSEYGKTKLKAEEAVINSGLPSSIIRIPWGYGPGMTPDTHVRKLLQSVYEKKIFTIFNFAGQVSLISVEDLADSFIFIAENHGTLNQTYFVTDGSPISLGNLFQLMGNTLNVKAGYINIPAPITFILRKLRAYLPLTVQNLSNNVLTASNEKISALGFSTKIKKKEGILNLAKSIGIYGE